jgi:hypothetical protein
MGGSVPIYSYARYDAKPALETSTKANSLLLAIQKAEWKGSRF